MPLLKDHTITDELGNGKKRTASAWKTYDLIRHSRVHVPNHAFNDAALEGIE
ncbi:hypothetical protein ABIC22_003553 [Paenibacillus sp. PvP094]